MSQQSIIGRITSLARANINALLDQAEDPKKMLDQMVRDYTSAISDAEGAVAQTIGNLRMMEEDAREEQSAAAQWGTKAAAASKKADELRMSTEAEADRFDDLARIALRNQMADDADARTLAVTIADQSAVVERLKEGLQQMRMKLDELRRKRDEMVGRPKTVNAQTRVREAARSVDILDPTSEIARFEEKIRREEARIRGHEELAASSLDAQWASLESDATSAEVEAALQRLKSR
jgi:phage shock protein A